MALGPGGKTTVVAGRRAAIGLGAAIRRFGTRRGFGSFLGSLCSPCVSSLVGASWFVVGGMLRTF
jgi:hypothetical protein